MGGQGFDESFQKALRTQSWSLYSVGMLIICLRTFARLRRARGFTYLAPDDWLMMTAVPALYTGLVVTLNVIATGGGSNLYPPEQLSTFSAEDIEERIFGSKLVVVSEQCMLNHIWTLKVCMLFMYARMTSGTRHIRYVKYLAVYIALGWVAVEIAFFTACHPFSGYWGMPPPSPECATLKTYAIINGIFNMSSDVCMLLIPLPVLVSLSLPLKQKIMLGIVFSMGVFVIIAAILTKVYNLSDVYDTAYMLWYIREASVAAYVANLPGIWPLLRENIKFLRELSSQHASSGLPRYGTHSHLRSNPNGTIIGTGKGSRIRSSRIELDDMIIQKSANSSTKGLDEREEYRVNHFSRKLTSLTHRSSHSIDSDERALAEFPGLPGTGTGWDKISGVRIDKTIEVKTEERGNANGDRELASRGSSRSGEMSTCTKNVERERSEWEVETHGPRIRIEGPGT